VHAADNVGVAEERTAHAGPADRDYDLIVIGGGADLGQEEGIDE
jgi:hypothetical protein